MMDLKTKYQNESLYYYFYALQIKWLRQSLQTQHKTHRWKYKVNKFCYDSFYSKKANKNRIQKQLLRKLTDKIKHDNNRI